MAIPERRRDNVAKLLNEFCETRVPEHVRDQVRLSFRFEGSVVFLTESRPPYDGRGGWTHLDVARFRYFASRREWVLYWSDRNSKWHRYDRGSWTGFKRLLHEVDEDPTCIFWG